MSVWQTRLSDTQFSRKADGLDYYSSAKVNNRLDTLVNQVGNTLTNYDIVQFVCNGKVNDNSVFTKGIKLTGNGGQNVYGNTTTNDNKYSLKRNTDVSSKNVNDSDIDVDYNRVGQTVYRVSSDTNGNVTVYKNGNSLQSISKTQTIANFTNAEVKELDNKTKIVSNFILSIDRNMGNDQTVSDHAWYNEAWGGVEVVKSDYIYSIGYMTPASRTTALDPKLIPKINGMSDLYTKYYTTAFRLNETSKLYSNKGEGYVGSYSGVDVHIPAWVWAYKSRDFYIPNATVMNLQLN